MSRSLIRADLAAEELVDCAHKTLGNSARQLSAARRMNTRAQTNDWRCFMAGLPSDDMAGPIIILPRAPHNRILRSVSNVLRRARAERLADAERGARRGD